MFYYYDRIYFYFINRSTANWNDKRSTSSSKHACKNEQLDTNNSERVMLTIHAPRQRCGMCRERYISLRYQGRLINSSYD